MKCPNCFCAVADSVEICPCCGFVLKSTLNDNRAVYQEPALYTNCGQCSNFIPINKQQSNKNDEIRSDSNNDLKLNIIIAMLAIIILLNLLGLILN